MNWFDRSDIVIHDIDTIKYHQDTIYPIEFTGERLIISMGLDPELLRSKKKRWDYGSQYSSIYCYCVVHSSSYCFFTYNLRKNSQSKWLIWLKLDLLVLINDWRNERKGFKFQVLNGRVGVSSIWDSMVERFIIVLSTTLSIIVERYELDIDQYTICTHIYICTCK